MTEFAGAVLRRNRVGNDGKTALERLKGRKSLRPVPEFAEGVMFLPLKTEVSDGACRAYPGVFLGIRDRSDELVFTDGEGVIRARDYRCRMPSEQWRPDEVFSLKAKP